MQHGSSHSGGHGDTSNVGRLSTVRKTCRNLDLGEDLSRAWTEFAAARFPIHKSRDDPIWTILLEPGLPILPSRLPVIRWRPSAPHPEL